MRTDSNLNAICEALAGNCGDLYDACLRTGLSLQFVAQWQSDDADAGARITEATRLGSMRLESAAIRRAVHGILEPVFYQGEVVGHKAAYSDGLLQTLLKGRMAHIYAPDSEGARQVFNGPVQINNMPRAGSYEEWLEMKMMTLAARDDNRGLLPAPLRVLEPPIDAEYTRREPAFAGVDL